MRIAPLLALLIASSAAAESPPPAHEPKRKSKKPAVGKVVVSGYLTALYKFRIEQDGEPGHDPDVLRLGKAVVRVAGRVERRVGYVVEIDPRSPTIAGVLRDGYATLHLLRGHELRIGQQKTPFGYENWQSSTELYTITRSELSEGIGRGVTHRDLGVGLVGKVALADGLRLEDAVAVVNGAGFGVQADDTQMKNLWARVGVRWQTGDLTVHAGVSGALGDQLGDPGPTPPVRFSFRRAGGDLEVDHRWFFAGVEAAIGFTRDPATADESESDLAYVAMVAGKTCWHAGPVVRYDAADADGWRRLTAGAYYGEPDARWRVRAHYEWYADDDVGTHDGRVMADLVVRFSGR